MADLTNPAMTWSMIVELIRAGLFSLAHFCGGSMGLAIVVATIAFRAIMFPFTLRAARRQATAPARKPVLDFGTLAQFPVGLGLFAAIRGIGERAGGFLWMKTLARPDGLFALLAALVAGGLSWLGASAQTLNGAPAGSAARTTAALMSVLFAGGLTLAMLLHVPAGVAVYSITSSLAGFGERRLVARLTASKAKAAT